MPRLTLVACLLAGTMATPAAAQGPYERQKIDVAAATRGRALYARHCINCHGSTAKGSDRGPDLVRSTVVLHDRLGAAIGPATAVSPTHQASLTAAEIVDLSHFLHQRIESIAVNRTPRGPINVLTGDPEAGRAYFNGAGGCRACHSPTADLAGVATRVADPVNLQQRMLFPTLRRDGPRQLTVSVTTGTTTIAGTLVRIDDFFVSLRDESGAYHAFDRGPAATVVVTDPLAAHHALLDRYTDADMHNLTAYLATLK
jgi:cytochrome c oxidase cbb3-type subunit 3